MITEKNPKFFINLPDGDDRKVEVWWVCQDQEGNWHLSITINTPNEVKPMNDVRCLFKVGDKVEKVGGDYKFEGTIVAVFPKLSGLIRLVVEDDRGVLHVYSEKNLKRRD